MSPRALAAFKSLAYVSWFALLPAVFILTYALALHYGWTVSLLAILLPGWLLKTILHECGHWWAARWRGMIVSQVVIACVELQPRRRGVRWRFTRLQLRGVGGYVLAYPDAAGDMRRDLMGLSLGGPLTNLIATTLCGAVAWRLGHSPAQTLWVLWGLLHLGAFLFNLIPHQLAGGLGTDGLMWMRAWLNRFEDLPGSSFMEMQGRILRGTALNDLPAGLSQRLLEEPEPMPAMHDWLRMYAALERGELEQARTDFQALCVRVEGYEEPMQLALDDLLTLCRADLAFAGALELDPSRALASLTALNLNARVFWYVPHVPPRLRALAAALRGDIAVARAQLTCAARYADNSPFLATVSSEARLRQRIEAIIEQGVPAGPMSPPTP
ncbi:M50 family metallopeptidase [Lysobacter sp. CA199]|uniref:M50 family metallopeptidase n=1 Tax=Lysobacter sp. CA199 TaxID=3455608 RepID=UPI003F8D0B8A